MQRLFPAAGLLVAVLATVVVVRVWRGERALAQGRAAQRRGDLNAADAAYRAASGCGNADAAAERARLEILRRDWAGAAGSLREAMALAPTRGLPHVLQAELEMNVPGPWDAAREERVLGACRIAAVLDPHRARTRRECAIITRSLAVLRRTSWDPARTRAVLAEAVDGFGVVLSHRDPLGGWDESAARNMFSLIIDGGGDPLDLVEAAFRHSDSTVLASQIEFLTKWRLWGGAEPGIPAARRRFAGLLASRKRYVEAEREVRALVKQDAQDTETWFLLGEILRSSGRVAEAAAAYRAADRQK